MINEAKNNIAKYIFNKKFLNKNYSINIGNKFLSASNDFLFLLPGNDNDFKNGFDVVRYFLIHKKNITLFLPEYKINLVPEGRKYSFIGYGIQDVNKIGLPNKNLIDKLREKKFDVVVDLNRNENLFYIAVANIVNAKFRVGFKRKQTETYYNFQVINRKLNSEISYRNLLNSVKMF